MDMTEVGGIVRRVDNLEEYQELWFGKVGTNRWTITSDQFVEVVVTVSDDVIGSDGLTGGVIGGSGETSGAVDWLLDWLTVSVGILIDWLSNIDTSSPKNDFNLLDLSESVENCAGFSLVIFIRFPVDSLYADSLGGRRGVLLAG